MMIGGCHPRSIRRSHGAGLWTRTVAGGRDGGHDRLVATGQTETAYVTGGRRLGLRLWDGSGTPVVLLHGLLDCALGWEPYAQRTSRRLVAVDLPGLGGSDPPRRPRLSAYAEDVLEALDEIGVSRFMAVGHSLGGGVAAAMADRAPTRVAGLVLVAPVGFGRVPVARALEMLGVSHAVHLALPLALGNRITASTIYRAVVANGARPDSELLEQVMNSAARCRPGMWAANRAIVAAGDSERSFARRGIDYDGHVEVLWGRADRLVPVEHVEGVRAALPQARITIQDRMGHHPQAECPDVLARFLERALARIEAGHQRAAGRPNQAAGLA
jgi:pimeloyl-ACP methyl ester carboxylesterase